MLVVIALSIGSRFAKTDNGRCLAQVQPVMVTGCGGEGRGRDAERQQQGCESPSQRFSPVPTERCHDGLLLTLPDDAFAKPLYGNHLRASQSRHFQQTALKFFFLQPATTSVTEREQAAVDQKNKADAPPARKVPGWFANVTVQLLSPNQV